MALVGMALVERCSGDSVSIQSIRWRLRRWGWNGWSREGSVSAKHHAGERGAVSTWVVVLIVLAVIALLVWGIVSMIHVLQEYERGVLFRLGRALARPKGPGLVLLLPFGIDRMRIVNLQEVSMNVPPQDVITKDNFSIRIDAVTHLQVVDPVRAAIVVQNYLFSVSQTVQTNLRVVLGRFELDTLLRARERINREVHQLVVRAAQDWGVEVLGVEIKDVDLPDDLRRAMAREAERVSMEARSGFQRRSEIGPIPSVPEGLAAALVKGDCVLFSGASTAPHAGWPTWDQILLRLLDRLEDEDSSLWRSVRELGEDPELTKDLVSGRLERSELLRHLQNILPVDEVRVGLPTLHRLLKQLPFAGVVTNSWDDVVERTFQGRTPTVLLPTALQDYAGLLRDKHFFLMRASGILSEDQLLFTADDYRRVMHDNKPCSRFVASLFTTTTLLFLSADLEEIEQFVVSSGFLSRPERTHYAVVPREADTELQQERMARRYNIQLLSYEATAGFPEVVDFIRSLAEKVSAKTRGPARSRQQRDVLQEVRLQNIGPFDDLTLSLHRGWNILLGDNGCGKSTVLKAISLALVGDDDRAGAAAQRLLKAHATSGAIELRLGEDVYRTDLLREDSRVKVVSEQFTPVQSGLLLSLGFPPLRGGGGQHSRGPTSSTTPNPVVNDLLPLLTDSVDERFGSLKQWIVNTALRSENPDPLQEQSLYAESLDSLFGLLKRMTPGVPFSFKRVDRASWDVVISTEDGDISIDLVSQGMSSIFGWVGTLVQRLAEVHDDVLEPTKREAIVLLDEIDAHLHPAWQQVVVKSLMELFPNVQFVVTTHSPLVVNGMPLDGGQVLILHRDDTHRAALYTQITDLAAIKDLRADQVLTNLFGLHSTRGGETSQMVSRYADLLGRANLSEDERNELEGLRRQLRHVLVPAESTVQQQVEAAVRQTLLGMKNQGPQLGAAGSRDELPTEVEVELKRQLTELLEERP
jgi:predicted ATPase